MDQNFFSDYISFKVNNNTRKAYEAYAVFNIKNQDEIERNQMALLTLANSACVFSVTIVDFEHLFADLFGM